LIEQNNSDNVTEHAKYCRNTIFQTMTELRILVDELETLTDSSVWPYPSYGEILYSVK